MKVIKAEPRHVDPAWKVMERCRAALDAQGVHQWDGLYPTRATIEDDIRRGALYVLEDEAGRCIGCVALDQRQADEYRELAWTTREPALVVHRLCVDPAEQGRGLADELMTFAESHAAERGCASVRLDAYTGNSRSERLYRRRGYREVGQVRFPRRPLPFWCFELPVPRRPEA
jgi:ribosomal protein S18 acetylase RimI-like enzyme